jgi:hypothetical protein
LTDGQVSGVVQRCLNRSTTPVPGTSNAFYLAELKDAIPFNFGNGGYNFTLTDSIGAPIPFGQGDWVVDTDAGVLTFYSTIPANRPPKISFFRYVGLKGISGGGGGIPEAPVDGVSYARKDAAWTALPAIPVTKSTFIYSLPTANGQFLSVDGTSWSSSQSGYTFSASGAVTRMIMKASNNINRNIVLYRNSTILQVYSIGNMQSYATPATNYGYNEGDLLRLFVENRSEPLKNVIIQIEVSYL